jgi:hypothetical protein
VAQVEMYVAGERICSRGFGAPQRPERIDKWVKEVKRACSSDLLRESTAWDDWEPHWLWVANTETIKASPERIFMEMTLFNGMESIMTAEFHVYRLVSAMDRKL